MADEEPRGESVHGADPDAPHQETSVPVGVVSHEGQERGHNEDSVIALKLELAGARKDVQLYAVADGAGGMAAGELASQLTVRAVKHSVAGSVADAVANTDDPYAEWLAAAVHAANYLVHLQAEQDKKRMASTLVMALVAGDRIHIANVGDSRAYLISEDGLRQVTEDHSAVQELVRAGLITTEQVKEHPYGHVLTRAIGPEDDVEPDLFTERVHSGDRLLLCTDGLTNMVPEAEIWRIVREARDSQAAAQALIDAANRAGGKDNITAVVVEIRSAEPD